MTSPHTNTHIHKHTHAHTHTITRKHTHTYTRKHTHAITHTHSTHKKQYTMPIQPGPYHTHMPTHSCSLSPSHAHALLQLITLTCPRIPAAAGRPFPLVGLQPPPTAAAVLACLTLCLPRLQCNVCVYARSFKHCVCVYLQFVFPACLKQQYSFLEWQLKTTLPTSG